MKRTMRRSLAAAAAVTVACASVVAAGMAPAGAVTSTLDLDGHGWGHGRGLGQYGSLGYALGVHTTTEGDGWSSGQILSHFYNNTTSGTTASGRDIAVRLLGRDGRNTRVHIGSGQLATVAGAGEPELAPGSAVRIDVAGPGAFKIYDGDACGGPWALRGTYSADQVRVLPAESDLTDVVFGQEGDTPLIGDWDGDGIDTIGVRRGTTFFLRNANTAGPADARFTYGEASDQPLVGDWDGDGTDTVAVRRGNTFYLRGLPKRTFKFGKVTDRFVVGDWDGDGRDSMGARRGRDFLLRNPLTTGKAETVFTFGDAADVPVAGDWDGDGVTTTGLRRGTQFRLRSTNTTGPATHVFGFPPSTAAPLTGDWNGDGKTTTALHTGTTFTLAAKNQDAGGTRLVTSSDLPRERTLQACGDSANPTTWYRGELRAINFSGNQRTVNAVKLEQYLRGVVPRESPASWGDAGSGRGMAALEAQAVAARSYAAAEDRYPYAETCDTTACQVYGGRGKLVNGSYLALEDSRSDTAIANTNRKVRILNGAIARTEFSSSTGGYTAGGTFPAVPDKGDAVSSNPNHLWDKDIARSTIENVYKKGTLQSISRSGNGFGDFGGRTLEVTMQFSGGKVVVTGDAFRRTFGLKSDWYKFAWV